MTDMKREPDTEMINVENLSFSYPGSAKAALQAINAGFEKGKYYVILGRNGSGTIFFNTQITDYCSLS